MGKVDDFRSQERARSLRNPSAKRTGLRCPEPRTARHPKARKPKNVPAGRMQFEKAGSLPKRENGSPKANHFVKPSAEPNPFELCRGEKWTKKNSTISLSRAQSRTRSSYAEARNGRKKFNVFDKPRAIRVRSKIAEAGNDRVKPLVCIKPGPLRRLPGPETKHETPTFRRGGKR